MAIRANRIQRSMTKKPKANDIGAAGTGHYPPEEAPITSSLNRPYRPLQKCNAGVIGPTCAPR